MKKTAKIAAWILGVIFFISLMFVIFSSDSPSQNEGSSQNNSSGQSGGATTNYYPSSGGARITESSPGRAYIDPNKTWVKNSGKGIKFVYEQDKSITFTVGEGNVHWEDLPAGNYLVYPYKCTKTSFSWGQGTLPD